MNKDCIPDQGFIIQRKVIDKATITQIKAELEASVKSYPKRGIRNADKKFNSIKKLAQSAVLMEKAQAILGSKPDLVRVIFFDKTPDSNWLVTWHQDKTIAVSDKLPIEGWGPWSIKDGVHHVQPDVAVLNQMITFRLHLDDSNRENGCLRVIPKSHLLGLLSSPEIQQIIQQQESCFCEVAAGDMVIMRPHILHASSKSTVAGHRRVVHIEYSNYVLPDGLNWGGVQMD